MASLLDAKRTRKVEQTTHLYSTAFWLKTALDVKKSSLINDEDFSRYTSVLIMA